MLYFYYNQPSGGFATGLIHLFKHFFEVIALSQTIQINPLHHKSEEFALLQTPRFRIYTIFSYWASLPLAFADSDRDVEIFHKFAIPFEHEKPPEALTSGGKIHFSW